jgi:hypothetical protein
MSSQAEQNPSNQKKDVNATLDELFMMMAP